MRHKKKGKIFGRVAKKRSIMLRNLACSVIMYEKVKTTETKAKAVRSIVEKSITIAKKGDLTARRRLIAKLPQELAVRKLMEKLGDKYKERPGGYTRVVKLGFREGDGAKIAQIELV